MISDDPPILYECPNCGYLLIKIELESARYDYPCPKCRKTVISEFEISEKNKND